MGFSQKPVSGKPTYQALSDLRCRGESRSGLANHCPVQEMHSQTADAQILVSADWVTDVSVCSVALFVSETVNRHGKELHAILEIVVDVWSCSSFYVDFPFPNASDPVS